MCMTISWYIRILNLIFTGITFFKCSLTYVQYVRYWLLFNTCSIWAANSVSDTHFGASVVSKDPLSALFDNSVAVGCLEETRDKTLTVCISICSWLVRSTWQIASGLWSLSEGKRAMALEGLVFTIPPLERLWSNTGGMRPITGILNSKSWNLVLISQLNGVDFGISMSSVVLFCTNM